MKRFAQSSLTLSSALRAGLYLVATPIGNLHEISARALDLLSAVDLVLCEDTRHSRKLFSHYGLHPKVQSYHRFNESAAMHRILEEINAGLRVALVTDAGAPGIADPGTRLVAACHRHGYGVFPISGPCAIVNAVMGSGMADQGFVFAGFAPAKSIARSEWLAGHLRGTLPFVVFEAPHRIAEFLDDLAQLVLPDHQLCVARELTKKFEEIHLATVTAHRSRIAAQPVLKGEYTLVVAPFLPSNDELPHKIETDFASMAALFAAHKVGTAVASAMLAQLSGLPRRHCYQTLLTHTS